MMCFDPEAALAEGSAFEVAQAFSRNLHGVVGLTSAIYWIKEQEVVKWTRKKGSVLS